MTAFDPKRTFVSASRTARACGFPWAAPLSRRPLGALEFEAGRYLNLLVTCDARITI
jgi:hypothetical protein